MEYANLFPGIGIELLCAVWLMLAAYGSGSLVFLKTSQKPSQLVMLVCGMAVNAALGVFVIPSVMILPLGIVGCFGAYKLFFEIKKADIFLRIPANGNKKSA